MIRELALTGFGFLLFTARASAQFVNGDLFISTTGDHIYRVDASLNVTVFADWTDGLNISSALIFSASDTLLVSNLGSATVLEFDSAGNGSVLYDSSSGLASPFGENGLAWDSSGNLYVSDFFLKTIFEFPAGGGAPSVFADANDGLGAPDGLAFDLSGNLMVANHDKGNVLSIDTSGNVTVFDDFSFTAIPYSIVTRSNGDIYVATVTVSNSSGTVYRYPGGDASQRQLLAVVQNSYLDAALQIGLDDQTLYYTSGLGELVTIDADTGSMTQLFPFGTLPDAVSIAIYRAPARWTNYGSGFPGTNGVPAFTARQPPNLGTTTTLDLGNSLGLPTFGLLFAGLARIDFPSNWGGDLLVDANWIVPVSFSYGNDSFDWDVPNDPALVGMTIDLQAIEADPGAAKGVSFTAGLELVPGY